MRRSRARSKTSIASKLSGSFPSTRQALITSQPPPPLPPPQLQSQLQLRPQATDWLLYTAIMGLPFSSLFSGAAELPPNVVLVPPLLERERKGRSRFAKSSYDR